MDTYDFSIPPQHQPIFRFMNEIIKEKLVAGTKSFKWRSETADEEILYEFSESVFVLLIHALSNGDTFLFHAILEVESQFGLLKSIYLMRLTQFCLDKSSVDKAVMRFTALKETGVFDIPEYLSSLISLLAKITAVQEAEPERMDEDEYMYGDIAPENEMYKTADESELCKQIPAEDNITQVSMKETWEKDILIALLVQDTLLIEKLLSGDKNINSICVNGQPLLHIAAEQGCSESVECLLNLGARVDRRDSERLTPLHKAVESNDESTVLALIQNEANMYRRLDGGETYLMYAISKGCLAAASALVSTADETNHAGETALFHAVRLKIDESLVSKDNNCLTNKNQDLSKRKLDAIKLLLNHRGKIFKTNNNGETLLHYAAQTNDKDIIRYLVKSGIEIDCKDKSGDTPLHNAVKSHNPDIVELLFTLGAEVDISNNFGVTPLHLAVLLGYVSVVNILLEINAYPDVCDKDGYTPLFLAARAGHSELVNILTMEHAKVNVTSKKGLTPLHLAASGGYLACTRLLLERGAEIDCRSNDGNSPLHCAAKKGNFDVVKLLVERGAGVNSVNQIDSTTPLILAVRSGCLSTVQFLIEEGAHVNYTDKNGESPLFAAVTKGHVVIIKFLIEKGAFINSKTNKGMTPLHCAVRMGKFDITQFLVEEGADVDSQDSACARPLHYAVGGGHVDITRYLLKRGANVKLEDSQGKSPLEYSITSAQFSTAQTLIEHGADILCKEPCTSSRVFALISKQPENPKKRQRT